MDLGKQRASSNVEDRRGMGAAAGGIGVGGIVIALIAYFLGFDPGPMLDMAQQQGASGGSSAQEAPRGAPADEPGQFVSRVLGSTEDVWGRIFEQSGVRYEPPTLVLYDGQVRSACGMGQSAMGPFYCPNDRKLYIDLSFFRDLQTRFRAPGDFAQAYVVAHEVAHHVQNLTGQMQNKRDSVRLELQADCLAGVWAHHAQRMRNVLEPGDVEEALKAASAIGDDRLQKQARGYAVPDSFTHGTSEQRSRWFRRGLDKGTLEAADTFSARDL